MKMNKCEISGVECADLLPMDVAGQGTFLVSPAVRWCWLDFKHAVRTGAAHAAEDVPHDAPESVLWDAYLKARNQVRSQVYAACHTNEYDEFLI